MIEHFQEACVFLVAHMESSYYSFLMYVTKQTNHRQTGRRRQTTVRCLRWQKISDTRKASCWSVWTLSLDCRCLSTTWTRIRNGPGCQGVTCFKIDVRLLHIAHFYSNYLVPEKDIQHSVLAPEIEKENHTSIKGIYNWPVGMSRVVPWVTTHL